MKLKIVLSYHPLVVSFIEILNLRTVSNCPPQLSFPRFFQAVSLIEKLTLNTRLAELSQGKKLSAFERQKTAKKLKRFRAEI